MPLRDPDRKREYQRSWYGRNAEDQAAKGRVRQARYRARNLALLDQLLLSRCPGCGSSDRGHLQGRGRDLYRLARSPCSVAKLRAAVLACGGNDDKGEHA